jgi:signal transduction histidine kinase
LTGPVSQPPLDALPPDAPATVEDVRASRRWTWVALAWAVAASAIAVIALINANNKSSDNTATQTTPDVTQQLQTFQKDTNARLDAFSRRLSDKAAQTDVASLDKRLTKVEDDAAQAKSDAAKQAAAVQQLQSDVKDLQQRVSDLESQQQNQGTTTTP